MKVKRIIPRLDIKGPNLVKGIHLEGLRVLGKPSEFAKYYYEQGADELLFMDVVASLYERNSLHSIISETAKSIFIPITVGGGIRTIEDIRSVLRSGADKVSINTAAFRNPAIIGQASKIFGSSTIVVAIEAIKEKDGTYRAYTDNGREHTGIEVVEWARKMEASGAGELIITSVDREGTGEGYDIELINRIARNVSIPVIAHGGGGSKNHIKEVLHSEADAVALASLLHYDFINKNHTSGSAIEGNTEFLNKKRAFHSFEPLSLSELKRQLNNEGIISRL
jgi:cyclase